MFLAVPSASRDRHSSMSDADGLSVLATFHAPPQTEPTAKAMWPRAAVPPRGALPAQGARGVRANRRQSAL